MKSVAILLVKLAWIMFTVPQAREWWGSQSLSGLQTRVFTEKQTIYKRPKKKSRWWAASKHGTDCADCVDVQRPWIVYISFCRSHVSTPLHCVTALRNYTYVHHAKISSSDGPSDLLLWTDYKWNTIVLQGFVLKFFTSCLQRWDYSVEQWSTLRFERPWWNDSVV